MAGAASFTIYTRTKEFCRDHQLVDHTKLLGSAIVGGLGGAMAGSLISFGSARESASGFFLFSLLSPSVSLRTCQGNLEYVDNVIMDRQLTIGAFSGPETAGIHDRREEGGQVGEASEYRHRCA